MEIDMIKQIQTKNATITSILRSKAFVTGFSDARKGTAFDPDKYRWTKEQWDYERGRLLAFEFNGMLKNGRTVTTAAILAYARAQHTGALI
jgi:hypothetical protein